VAASLSIAPADAASDPPAIRSTTVEDIFKQISRSTGDVLTLTGNADDQPYQQKILTNRIAKIFALKTLPRLRKLVEAQERKFRFQRYNAVTEVLIISIPTAIHEQLHTSLYLQALARIIGMGLLR
jgi:hypothetical protein